MPTYQFEAMDATGQEIRDVLDAASEDEAQTTIRQMGYFVTKISVKKGAGTLAEQAKKKKRGLPKDDRNYEESDGCVVDGERAKKNKKRRESV